MATLSEKLLKLKEKGLLRALKKKWLEPSEEQKQQCGLSSNWGDQTEKDPYVGPPTF